MITNEIKETTFAALTVIEESSKIAEEISNKADKIISTLPIELKKYISAELKKEISASINDEKNFLSNKIQDFDKPISKALELQQAIMNEKKGKIHDKIANMLLLCLTAAICCACAYYFFVITIKPLQIKKENINQEITLLQKEKNKLLSDTWGIELISNNNQKIIVLPKGMTYSHNGEMSDGSGRLGIVIKK